MLPWENVDVNPKNCAAQASRKLGQLPEIGGDL